VADPLNGRKTDDMLSEKPYTKHVVGISLFVCEYRRLFVISGCRGTPVSHRKCSKRGGCKTPLYRTYTGFIITKCVYSIF
jgi:hypothetical protein